VASRSSSWAFAIPVFSLHNLTRPLYSSWSHLPLLPKAVNSGSIYQVEGKNNPTQTSLLALTTSPLPTTRASPDCSLKMAPVMANTTPQGTGAAPSPVTPRTPRCHRSWPTPPRRARALLPALSPHAPRDATSHGHTTLQGTGAAPSPATPRTPRRHWSWPTPPRRARALLPALPPHTPRDATSHGQHHPAGHRRCSQPCHPMHPEMTSVMATPPCRGCPRVQRCPYRDSTLPVRHLQPSPLFVPSRSYSSKHQQGHLKPDLHY